MTQVHLFTHNDLDGIGCGILAKLAFGDKVNIDYCSNANIDRKVKRYIKNNKDANTAIYITDISLYTENAKLVDAYYQKGKFVQMIDHHRTAQHFNAFPWGMVQEAYEDGRKTAATSLFYEYLVKNNHLQPTPFLDAFVELVRSYDTWEWATTDNQPAKQLNDLFYLVGMSAFEQAIIERSTQETFQFTEAEQFVLALEEKKMNRYIDQKEHQMIQMWFKNFNIGVVYGEQFHSELGNTLHVRHPYLDMIVILNPASNKLSIRTFKEDINVSQFAKRFGGGGHPKASGAPITQEAFTRFIAGLFGKQSIRKDAEENKYNKKESQFGTLYMDRHRQYVSIVPTKEGKWSIFKNEIFLAENFTTFEAAEHFAKRALSAYLVQDDVYIQYIVEKYALPEEQLRSQFERTVQNAKKEILL